MVGCPVVTSLWEEFSLGTQGPSLPKLQGIGKRDFGKVTPFSVLTPSERFLSQGSASSVAPANWGFLEARLGALFPLYPQSSAEDLAHSRSSVNVH